MKIELTLLLTFAGLIVGGFLGALLRARAAGTKITNAEREAAQIVETAKKEADTLRKEADIEAKDVIFQAKAAWEEEVKEARKEILAQEKRLVHKEENLDRKAAQVEEKEQDQARREQSLTDRDRNLQQKAEEIDALVVEQRRRLESLSGMTSGEAKQQLMAAMESEARHDAAKRIRQIEDEAKESADKKAKKILSLAIQRFAGDYVAEKTINSVALPSDEMKGRIIGREGRNIRAIEAATGIDLIIDDTPEAVIISGFNPVRREVARLALEKLIADGRIHPARIEEVVKKAEQEVDSAIREAGEQATFDVGVHGIHPEIVKIIGRLRYRTSYGQNVLHHSHALSYLIGADLARKYGEAPEIVHAIAAHHEEEKPETILAVLVQAADALSGARPGARREMLETYVKRLEDLERIGTSFNGVMSCYAIQAGREIRVMVSSEQVSDDQSHVMAKDIARKIENEMTYPGQIRVNVIRETRATDYAK
ncbi:MAG: ribonuclease Y [Desulfuromonadales bacterium]